MLAAALRPSDLPVRSCRYRCEDLERVKGIEPSSSAWKAVALPLSYTRTRSSLHTKDRRPALANRLARRRASTIERLRRACLRLTSRSAERAKAGGGGRTRTYEGVSQRIYSPPPLPLGTLPRRLTLHEHAGPTGPVYGEAMAQCQPRPSGAPKAGPRGARRSHRHVVAILAIGSRARDCGDKGSPCAAPARTRPTPARRASATTRASASTHARPSAAAFRAAGTRDTPMR